MRNTSDRCYTLYTILDTVGHVSYIVEMRVYLVYLVLETIQCFALKSIVITTCVTCLVMYDDY